MYRKEYNEYLNAYVYMRKVMGRGTEAAARYIKDVFGINVASVSIGDDTLMTNEVSAADDIFGKLDQKIRKIIDQRDTYVVHPFAPLSGFDDAKKISFFVPKVNLGSLALHDLVTKENIDNAVAGKLSLSSSREMPDYCIYTYSIPELASLDTSTYGVYNV